MKNNYIDNKAFMDALIDYKEKLDLSKQNNTEPPKISNFIGECFYKLANNLAKRPNFCSYTYKDEMISDGIENCVQYMSNFDPFNNKHNPFGYFTKICWYAFLRRIAKEKKQQYIKYKATENFGVLDEEELLELNDGTIAQIQIYDNMYEFIAEYEDDMEKKKEISKKKRGVEEFLDD